MNDNIVNFLRASMKYIKWESMAKHEEIPLEIIDEFCDNIEHSGWEEICEGVQLTEDFMRKHQDKLSWYFISTNQKLSEEFIREFQDQVKWHSIFNHQYLSEDFIREFAHKSSWYYVSNTKNLSEDFIREFQDQVEWSNICTFQNLSEDFMREFQDKLDWDQVAQHQKISKEFIEEFQTELEHYYLAKNRRAELTKDVMFKNKSKYVDRILEDLELSYDEITDLMPLLDSPKKLKLSKRKNLSGDEKNAIKMYYKMIK